MLDGDELVRDANGVANLTFAPNQTARHLVVVARSDNLVEPTERFRVTVLAPTGGADPNHAPPTTVTRYDALGRVELVTDPLGRTTQYAYDELGRRDGVYQNVRTPEFGQWEYDGSVLQLFDAADNVRQVTREGFVHGPTTTTLQTVTDRYGYDVLNRQTKSELASSATGFLVGVTGGAVTRTRYDALDRVLWEFDPKLPHAIDTAGRTHTKGLSRRLGTPPEGQVWLHEPDMRVGGLPTDAVRFGNARADFVVGGQADRIAAAVLALPDNTTFIRAAYTHPKPRG